ncbi:protein TolA [Pseudidiomarina insulisalsae]|uniref:Protein TolA n=1 Tax=Pseudidiomarina insulisalsae TaxID=575789 RepID=A0A432YLX3_9GAMM|nr:protein TolA [Pseudidiomarina insulisalsae]
MLSVALHLGIVVILFAGSKFSPSVPEAMEVQLDAPLSEEVMPEEEIVQAATVDKAKVEQQLEAIRAAEQQRKDEIAELERRAAEAKRQREAEQQRQRELEAEQRAERERLAREKEAALKEQREAERKAAEAEKKRKAEEEAARKAEAERKRREEEARRLEEERKRKEQEARERAERERQLQEELERERQARAAARSRQVQSELGKYTNLIKATIQRNLIADPSMQGKSCTVNIRLAPSGFVISVNRISGDAGVCKATENAVLKAGTLPVSEDPEVFAKMKDINLTFAPEFN